MSQRAATIESLPMTFEFVKAMQVGGWNGGEGVARWGGRRLPRSLRARWRLLSIAISNGWRRMLPLTILVFWRAALIPEKPKPFQALAIGGISAESRAPNTGDERKGRSNELVS
jgi:hypothetical protein